MATKKATKKLMKGAKMHPKMTLTVGPKQKAWLCSN